MVICAREETTMDIKETVARDRIVSRLKELELPTHEALIYVTLLTNPNIPAGVLCNHVNGACSNPTPLVYAKLLTALSNHSLESGRGNKLAKSEHKASPKLFM